MITVEELLSMLADVPADANVVLSIEDHECDMFTVEMSDDGYVVLEG